MTMLFSHQSKDSLTIALVGLEWLLKSVMDNSTGGAEFSQESVRAAKKSEWPPLHA